MKTKIFKGDNLSEAGKILAEGGLVAFPTETVYGLGANAFDKNAVGKIFKAKGRPADNPLIVHISGKNSIEKLACEISDDAKKLIDNFMPGPFTVILKKKPGIPDEVTAGLDTVGIRFPANDTAVRFIEAAGVPVAAPSANISGKPSPTKAEHVIHDMDGKIDAVIDGGNCEVGVESTIVDASGRVPILLRPGGVTVEELVRVVPTIEIDSHILKSASLDEQPKCPGMKYTHYSPKADVIVVEGEKGNVQNEIKRLLEENSGKIAGVLTMYGSDYDNAVMISAGDNNREYAKNLFASLRDFDRLGVEIVFAEFCEKDGYGLAVKNRLYKAAGNDVRHV